MPKTLSYDAAGNVTGDGAHSYGYDDRGRLVDVDAGAASYVHNGLGQRVKKDNGSVTLFAYDEAGRLVGEYDASGTAVQETVWFAGAPVALLQGTDTFYVHSDHLGTPRAITDGGTVVWRWESAPFGETLADEDPDGDSNLLTYNLRFPGQYFDGETGQHYNYFRTYDPTLGRYLESDPTGLGGGINTYSYVGQNPLQFIDFHGLAAHDFIYRRARRSRSHSVTPAFYTGGEGSIYGGLGYSVVTCCNDKNERVEMTFTKTCVGPTINGGLAAGIVTGLTGQRCSPSFYQGYFLEINFLWFSLDLGVEPARGGILNGGLTGTNEFGAGAGFGAGVASCDYRPVMIRRIGTCSCGPN